MVPSYSFTATCWVIFRAGWLWAAGSALQHPRSSLTLEGSLPLSSGAQGAHTDALLLFWVSWLLVCAFMSPSLQLFPPAAAEWCLITQLIVTSERPLAACSWPIIFCCIWNHLKSHLLYCGLVFLQKDLLYKVWGHSTEDYKQKSPLLFLKNKDWSGMQQAFLWLRNSIIICSTFKKIILNIPNTFIYISCYLIGNRNPMIGIKC